MASDRSPGAKMLFALIVAAVLTIPLFTVYLLVYDRQNQSETARASIAQGWGGPQTLAGPMLVIPYEEQVTETVTEGNRPVTRTNTVKRELFVAPAALTLDTAITPERRARSIYEAIVYDAAVSGRAIYALPPDLPRFGVTIDRLQLDRAELRFGVSDPRGLKPRTRVTVNGAAVAPQPGNGLRATGGSGFFAFLNAGALRGGRLDVTFAFDLRGNSTIALEPRAGQTAWRVRSPWPHPSFNGGFLPETRSVTAQGFTAAYQISNLALGTTLLSKEDAVGTDPSQTGVRADAPGQTGNTRTEVGLIEPVDLYSQVNRSVKYGFLFIGFTFLAFLMFDVVGGRRVSAVEYLLVGAGLVLFFVMLLAFAEIFGFQIAYLAAAGAITLLLTLYSMAVLKSALRGGLIMVLLIALYGVLYVLLSLEAYSLLIGSLLLFAALAAVMYLTRNLEWGGSRAAPAQTD